MKTGVDHDHSLLADPLPALNNAVLVELIICLRRFADVLELHHALRGEAESSPVDERQLDMWNGGNPF